MATSGQGDLKNQSPGRADSVPDISDHSKSREDQSPRDKSRQRRQPDKGHGIHNANGGNARAISRQLGHNSRNFHENNPNFRRALRFFRAQRPGIPESSSHFRAEGAVFPIAQPEVPSALVAFSGRRHRNRPEPQDVGARDLQPTPHADSGGGRMSGFLGEGNAYDRVSFIESGVLGALDKRTCGTDAVRDRARSPRTETVSTPL